MFVNLFVNLSTLYSFYENSTRVNSLSSISWGLSSSNIKWFLSGKKKSRIIRYNQNPLFVNKNDNFNYRENYIVIIISGCNALLIGWKKTLLMLLTSKTCVKRNNLLERYLFILYDLLSFISQLALLSSQMVDSLSIKEWIWAYIGWVGTLSFLMNQETNFPKIV